MLTRGGCRGSSTRMLRTPPPRSDFTCVASVAFCHIGPPLDRQAHLDAWTPDVARRTRHCNGTCRTVSMVARADRLSGPGRSPVGVTRSAMRRRVETERAGAAADAWWSGVDVRSELPRPVPGPPTVPLPSAASRATHDAALPGDNDPGGLGRAPRRDRGAARTRPSGPARPLRPSVWPRAPRLSRSVPSGGPRHLPGVQPDPAAPRRSGPAAGWKA